MQSVLCDSKRALVLVDIQNDFCPGGSLAVDKGDEVVSVANRLMQSNFFDLIVATADWHPENHSSFASNQNTQPFTIGKLNGKTQIWWPDHCIWGSPGAEFHPDLDVRKISAIIRKGMNSRVDSYSGFFDNGDISGKRHDTGLNRYLILCNELYIMGLATDYCVKYTALDAAAIGFDTYLILDGCRAVNANPDDSKRAIEEMKESKVKIVSSNDLLVLQ